MAPHNPRNPPEKYHEIDHKNRPPLQKNFSPTVCLSEFPASYLGAGGRLGILATNREND